MNVLTQTTVNFNFSKAKDFPKIDPDLVQNIKIPDANKQVMDFKFGFNIENNLIFLFSHIWNVNSY